MKQLLPSPLQCSVKVKIPGSDPTWLKTLDCQIISLGHHQYSTIGKEYKRMAFLPLDKDRGGGEFVVLVPCHSCLLVLTSAEMRWKRLGNIPYAFSLDIVTFRGRFYAACYACNTFVIDPYSLEMTLLFPVPKNIHFLVPCGDDELFLIEELVGIYPVVGVGGLDISQLTFRVSRLDEEAGKWVEVTDLGDRVLFIGGRLRNASFSAKELPYGCGLTGNSILFTHRLSNVTFAFKYGVHTGNTEDNLNCWRSSRENPVVKLNSSFPVMTLRIER